MHTIYLITNILNCKQYVGQTRQTIRQRWNSHVGDSKRSNSHIARAIKKYGKQAFKIETIVRCDASVVDEYEIMFIDIYGTQRCGYNLEAGGSHGLKRPTVEMRQRESRRRKSANGSDLPMNIGSVRNGFRVRAPDVDEMTFVSKDYSMEEKLQAAKFYLEHKEIPSWYKRRSVDRSLPKHISHCRNSAGNRGYMVVFRNTDGKRIKRTFTSTKVSMEQNLLAAMQCLNKLTATNKV